MINFHLNTKLILHILLDLIIISGILPTYNADTGGNNNIELYPKDSIYDIMSHLRRRQNNNLNDKLKKAWEELPEEDTVDNYTYCEAKVPDPENYTPLQDYEIVSVNMLTRHGARTPSYYLPPGFEHDTWNCAAELSMIQLNGFGELPLKKKYGLDCNPNEELCYINPLGPLGWSGNCTLGQLTPKGMRQLFDLGQRLHSIYSDQLKLIPGDWEEARKVIQVRSTDYWRTFQSVQSLIIGFFNQSISSSSTPLTIHSISAPLETLLINYEGCPNSKEGNQKQYSTSSYQHFLNQSEPIREAFSSVIGDKYLKDDPIYLEKVVDVFQSRQCHEKPAVCTQAEGNANESCIEEDWVNLAMAYANTEMRLIYRDMNTEFRNLPILRAGGFLMELKRNILFQVSNILKNDQLIDLNHKHFKGLEDALTNIKWFHFSAHDTSISQVLGALNAVDMRWPPYRSNVIVELWKKSELKDDPFENFQVRFIFNGSPVQFHWCDSGSCSLSDFLDYLDNQLGLVLGWEKYLENLSELKLVDFVKDCWS